MKKKFPKTLKGYLSMLNRIANMPISDLKGFDKLNEKERILFGSLSADIHNTISELNKTTND